MEELKIRRFKCEVCSFEFEKKVDSNQNEQFIINEIHCDKPMKIVFIDNPEMEFVLNSSRLNSLQIPKNRTAKLTLSIRQHQQKFLYDQMQTMNYEDRLEFISNHLTSLQEANYEMRERELATAKVKEHVLLEIEKLNKIDVEKYRKTGLIEESSIQKKERSKLEKDVKMFRRLNMSDSQIINILSPQGFSEEKIREALSAV